MMSVRDEKNKNNAVEVFIPESIPSSNKGEVGIFYGIKQGLRSLGDVSISLVTNDAESDAREYGPDVSLIRDNIVDAKSTIGKLLQATWIVVRHLGFCALFFVFGQKVIYFLTKPIWRAYLKADLIVFGHDNMLVGRFSLELITVPLMARVLHIPCVIYAGTVGPFADRPSKWLTRLLLNSVDLITLRESRSITNIDSLVIKNVPVYVTADAAFLMPPALSFRVEEISREVGIPSDRVLVGFTITYEMAKRYSESHGLNLQNGVAAYMQARADLLDDMVESFNVHIVAIAHCVELGERDDLAANHEILRRMRNKKALTIMNFDYRADELKGIIGECSLFIGERTHSMIASTSMSVPTIGVCSRITSSKTRGILGIGMGINEWLVDVETMKFDEFRRFVKGAFEQRHELSLGLSERAQVMHEKALLSGYLIAEQFPLLVRMSAERHR